MASTLLVATLVRAQIALPTLPLPGAPLPLPRVDNVNGALQLPPLSSVRLRAQLLQRRYPDTVERDPRGAAVIRSVILALSPDEAALQQALTRGFQIQSDRTLQPLGERMVTLLAPRGLSTRRALQQLRAADPAGNYDFDHLFTESASAQNPSRSAALGSGKMPDAVDIRVGLVDSGVDKEHPVFTTQVPQVFGCDGHPKPSVHGTAVASLFVARSPQFSGSAPGARLYAVDIYCDTAGPGGRVSDIVQALADLVAAQVRVINMSVVGPDNAILAAMVRKVLARSIVIVAASGNDGPNAAPLYPAAYAGVVAVAAVDRHKKVLMEAGAGEYVRFAAPGADMLAAVPGGGFDVVRGTSFASLWLPGCWPSSWRANPRPLPSAWYRNSLLRPAIAENPVGIAAAD
ncbi:MAG: S8 family serine peptidase [Pseudomonadota bacterium]